MTFSFLQLNINGDNYWENLIHYLSSHDFDVITLQELTGPETVCGNLNSHHDTYAELKNMLGHRYDSDLLVTDTFTSGPASYMAISIFYKKKFQLMEKQQLIMNKNENPFPSDALTFEGLGKGLLHLKLMINDSPVSFMTTHFAWAKTPSEEPHQTAQGNILLDYLNTVTEPFVLSGDFNLSPDQPLIQELSKRTQNLIDTYAVTNTLNPRFHRAKELFPKGIAIDYIFLSGGIKSLTLEVLEQEDISDHLGVTAKLEL
jgi:endonuclease/exonuclease/phosphatase family metal-dependent hydrolase